MKKELATQVNAYLANIGVSYIKLHNLHWNVVGSQFKAAHEYLETLYDALADVLDAIAELLKMNGEAPLASMKGYLSVATIPELESVELDVKSAMQTVLKDMESLRTQAFSFVSRPTRRINLMWLPTWKTMWQITTKQFGSFNLC